MMRWNFITFHPELFHTYFRYGRIGNAYFQKLCEYHVYNPKDDLLPKERIDDTPYGGGDGMVLRSDILERTLARIPAPWGTLIYMSPAAPVFDQRTAQELSSHSVITILSGRFAGVDERLLQHYQFRRLSIGDYILTSGDLPALVVVDSVLRFKPGVLGNEQSAQKDTFSDGLLEEPMYTKPPTFHNHTVPNILLSGDHQQIKRYKREEQLRMTARYRPDLIVAQWDSFSNSEKEKIKRFLKSSRE